MPTYLTEQAFCFGGRVTTYELESNTCLARGDAPAVDLLAPWDDGFWFLDLDGREVGWLELSGAFYPPPDGINPL